MVTDYQKTIAFLKDLDIKFYEYKTHYSKVIEFNNGDIDFNFDLSTPCDSIIQSEMLPEINSGMVKVKKEVNEYEISFDCVDENNKKVSGFYKGELKIFNAQ